MKFINKRQYIDLVKMDFIRIKVKQKDNGRYIIFRILQDGVTFDLTGKTIKFFATKPDGKEVFNNANITSSSNGECEVKLTSQTLAVPGIVECELVIYEGEEIISTFIFELDVKKSVRSNSAIESSHEYTVIEELMNKMKEWIEKTKESIKRVDDAIKKIPGKAELIPSIGSNGNWFIDGEDTGVHAAFEEHNHDERYIRKVRDLGASENLNDITQTGRYHQPSNTGASLDLNYPEAKAGLLVVYNDGYVYQEYHTYTNTGVYRRTKYGSTWYKWIKLNGISSATFTEGFSNGHVLYNNNGRVGAKAVLTPSDYEVGAGGIVKDISGKDIRSITVSGRYRGNNCPNAPSVSEGFTRWYFYDIEIHSPTYRKITAKHFSNNTIFVCTCTNGVWSDWSEVNTTSNGRKIGEDTGYLELPGGVVMQWGTATQIITKHNGQHWAATVTLPVVVENIINSSCSIVSASVIQGDPTSGLVTGIDSKVETKTQSNKTMSRVGLVWDREDKDSNTSIEVKVRVLVWGYKNE